MATKDIKWDSLWASQIYLMQKGGKDYVAAHVRKKYGENDVEPNGPGEYIGMKQNIVYEMTTDNDPESDTFNQRIPKEIVVYDAGGRELKQKVQKGINWLPIHEVSDEILQKYRKLVGHMPDPHGSTQFYWILGRSEKFQCYDVDEFFDSPLTKVRESLVGKKLLLKGKKKNDKKESE